MQREQQVIDSFSNIAEGILSQYVNDVAAITAIKGERPSFDELMAALKQLEKELTGKALKLIDIYKKEIGQVPEDVTMQLRQIIAAAIQKYVKTL